MLVLNLVLRLSLVGFVFSITQIRDIAKWPPEVIVISRCSVEAR